MITWWTKSHQSRAGLTHRVLQLLKMQHAPRPVRAVSVAAVENVGTGQRPEWFMVNTKTQTQIDIYEIHEQWARDNGYRSKPQAPSVKPEDLNAQNSLAFTKLSNQPVQASSDKRQAQKRKHQAPSPKHQAPRS